MRAILCYQLDLIQIVITFLYKMKLVDDAIRSQMTGHFIAGRVLDGMLTVRKIENVPTGANNKPKLPIVIVQCGQL